MTSIIDVRRGVAAILLPAVFSLTLGESSFDLDKNKHTTPCATSCTQLTPVQLAYKQEA